jgi:hypothetical protein
MNENFQAFLIICVPFGFFILCLSVAINELRQAFLPFTIKYDRERQEMRRTPPVIGSRETEGLR